MMQLPSLINRLPHQTVAQHNHYCIADDASSYHTQCPWWMCIDLQWSGRSHILCIFYKSHRKKGKIRSHICMSHHGAVRYQKGMLQAKEKLLVLFCCVGIMHYSDRCWGIYVCTWNVTGAASTLELETDCIYTVMWLGSKDDSQDCQWHCKMECAESVKALMHRQTWDRFTTAYRHADTNARSVDGHENGASQRVHCEQEHSCIAWYRWFGL